MDSLNVMLRIKQQYHDAYKVIRCRTQGIPMDKTGRLSQTLGRPYLRSRTRSRGTQPVPCSRAGLAMRHRSSPKTLNKRCFCEKSLYIQTLNTSEAYPRL